jgi:hypothetical protein
VTGEAQGPNDPDMEDAVDAADVQIEHSADGTLLHGTTRGDTEVIAVLKTKGFRWSRNLDAWYLPRNWTEPTRLQRVRATVADLEALSNGPTVAVDIDVLKPRRPAAERDADRRARAEARAERLDQRAATAAAASESAAAAAKRISDSIPFGQPILLGHHSQPRHEAALRRMRRHDETAWEQHKRALSAAEGADSARLAASAQESLVTIGNRIERTEAEVRRLEQRIHGAEGTYRAGLERELAELADLLAFDRAKLAEAGGVVYGRDNVRPGDLVQIRGQWYPVVRANQKTVSVPSAMAAADNSRWTNTAPWREVTDRLAISEATADQVRATATATSAAFPGLRVRLIRIARQLDDGQPADDQGHAETDTTATDRKVQ